jgi:DNA-binding Lrp family transcriptional regulator
MTCKKATPSQRYIGVLLFVRGCAIFSASLLEGVRMKEMTIEGNRRMTVKEVADALNLDVSTIQKRAREMFPESIRNGATTYLNEVQVTAIKLALTSNGHLGQSSEVVNAKTPLEKQLLIRQAMALQDEIIAELQLQLQAATPKLEAHAALMASEEDEPITKAMKSFGLHPRLHVFPFLVEKHYLTGTGEKYDPYLPSQKALNEDLMIKRETVCEDGRVRAQARIQKRQLDKWRTKMIPRIENWLEDV